MINKEFKEISLPVSDLQIGMHVIRLDRPWMETNFLLQGFVIHSSEEVLELQSQCDHVYVQVIIEDVASFETQLEKSRSNKKLETELNTDSGRKRIKYLNKVSFEQSIESSRMTFDSARGLARNILDSVRIGHAVDLNHCREVIEDVVESILANPDALLFLSQIKNKDDYTVEHSLNVSILSATFARFLGMPLFEIKTVGLAGLLHDVGKAKIPEDVLNKPGRFTPDEARVMSNHAAYGRDILMSLPQTDHSAIDVAHSHHERIDGHGYPRHLEHYQIPYFAKIVSLVDAYDAMTSHRVYGTAKSSSEALQIIDECKGTQFDDSLALEFIQCIGILPIGSIVELTNGEVGVVLNANEENPLKPKILLVRDASKKVRFPEKIIRLDQDISKNYKIKEELPNGSHGIKISEYVAKGLKLG